MLSGVVSKTTTTVNKILGVLSVLCITKRLFSRTIRCSKIHALHLVMIIGQQVMSGQVVISKKCFLNTYVAEVTMAQGPNLFKNIFSVIDNQHSSPPVRPTANCIPQYFRSGLIHVKLFNNSLFFFSFRSKMKCRVIFSDTYFMSFSIFFPFMKCENTFCLIETQKVCKMEFRYHLSPFFEFPFQY